MEFKLEKLHSSPSWWALYVLDESNGEFRLRGLGFFGEILEHVGSLLKERYERE